MSREKDLTEWVNTRSKIAKNLKAIDSHDDTIQEGLGIDKGDFEKYDLIQTLEEKEKSSNIDDSISMSLEEQSDLESIMDNSSKKKSKEMSYVSSADFNINDGLERIIFDEQELKILKTQINEFTSGNITSKKLKETILSSYIRIFEDIDKFISFLIIQESNELENTYKSNSKEQEEKEELLDELAIRINNIYTKLKAFPENSK